MSILPNIINLYRQLCGGFHRYLSDTSSLLLRLLLAKVFLDSGVLKWSGWFNFNALQYDLFKYEYFCPEPVREGALLLCDPSVLDYVEGSFNLGLVKALAVGSGILEVALPVLLILGLFTRIGALGLLAMTLFIQLAVYPSLGHWWNPAAWWAVVALAIMARGPGLFSLDHLFGLDRGRNAKIN